MDKVKVVIPKAELKRIIKRFFADPDRGISIKLFAELTGYSPKHLTSIFVDETEPMSELIQRRVSKAYKEYRDGEIAVMQNRDNSRFVQFRKEPKPVYERSSGLHLVNGEIKIKVGIKPKYDYSDSTLDEQLKGR